MKLCFNKLSKLPFTACFLPLSSRVGAGKDPIFLQKKHAAKDTRRALEKIILGFVIDGAARTVKLPDSSKADDLAMTTSHLLAGYLEALMSFQSVIGQCCNNPPLSPVRFLLLTPFIGYSLVTLLSWS